MDHEANIFHINAPAGELLQRYFPQFSSWKAVLPDAIGAWLQRQLDPQPSPAEALQIQSGGNHLLIRTATLLDGRHIILLQEGSVGQKTERLRSLGLSKREAQVLHWVGEGKSNREIGTILSISSRTVGKHLEVIFRKIDVDNRVAAVLRVKEASPG